MKMIVKHKVIYGGVLYGAGESVDIAPEHAEEMAQYGEVIEEQPAEEQTSGRKRK